MPPLRSGRCRASPYTPTACASSTIERRAGRPAELRVLRQRRDVAVHAEQRFDDDERLPAAAPALDEQRASAPTSLCGKTTRPRARQPDAVDQARVIALVREDDVAVLGQRRQHREVGEVAAREIERALGPLERGEPPLDVARRPRARRAAAASRCCRHPRARSPAAIARFEPRVRRRGPGSRSTRGRCPPAARSVRCSWPSPNRRAGAC